MHKKKHTARTQKKHSTANTKKSTQYRTVQRTHKKNAQNRSGRSTGKIKPHGRGHHITYSKIKVFKYKIKKLNI
jgi:hypothetical protein